ncbi:MAG: winged helix-turn-helix transcriptional regulator [Firmicutes bacterium]|nr:winged helix-turn-helix transcriptional regulator [Bacillota bacterium]
MKNINGDLHNILKIAPIINEIFFKSFHKSYEIPHGLNKTHIKTLLFLNFEGSCPMNLLSKKVNLEKGSFTPVAEKLINIGYLEKVKFPNDKRKSLLQLTPLGDEFITNHRNKHLSYVRSILSKLDENERETYLSAIRLVLSTSKKLLDD